MYKIYKIVDNTNGNVYIGQTKNILKHRINKHIQQYKSKQKYLCSSELILKNNDWKYELIEDNLNKEEAIIKEKYYIQNTYNCINKTRYDFDILEWNQKNKKQCNKKYREKNKDKIKKQRDENRLLFNENQKTKRHYINSWGGDPRYNNNLLNIDVNLFN